MKRPLKVIGVIIAVLLFVMFSCQVSSGPVGDDTRVIVDDRAREYHSVYHHFFNGEFKDQTALRVVTLREARDMKYQRDILCEKDFEGQSEPIFFVVLRQLGILSGG